MPHLERRYVPADREFQAWLFGVLDAVEYLRDGKAAGSGFKELAVWLENEVVEYYSEHQKFKKEQFRIAKREQAKWSHPAGKGAIPVPDRSVEPDRPPKTNVARGSAGVGKDVGSVGRVRDGRIVREWLRVHDVDPDASGERSDRVGCNCREVH